MATCYPKGNERALFNITYTTLTSTAIVARKRIKHGLLLKIDLISCEVRIDEKTGDESVLLLTSASLSTTAGFSVSRTISRVKTGPRVTKSTLIRLVPVRCVQFGPAVVIAVLSVWSQKTTQTQYHSYCQSQTSRMANEIIFSLSVCVSVFLVIRPRYHAVFL